MAKKKSSKSKDVPFEKLLEELEAVVAKLEGGQLGLAESLEQYEQGVKHLKACYEQLTQAERRIELVSGLDASGQPVTEVFVEEEEITLEEKGASRSRRRSSASARTRSEVDDGSTLF